MTWSDYKPIPGVDWATNGAQPTQRGVTIALVAFDFDDQPFVITQPKGSDAYGNPQIPPVPRQDVPKFYADFFNKPSDLNHGQTLNGYWMQQSGGKIGITDIKTYGPYRMPKKLYQYGLNDGFGQNAGANNACPAQTTASGAQASVTTIEVGSSAFFYVGDSINITGVSPSGAKTVTAIPDSTHITVSSAVTVPANAAIQDCMGSFNIDATNTWRAATGCTGNCGQTIHLFIYAGYDETSV